MSKGRKNKRLSAVQIKTRNIVFPIIGNILLFIVIALIISFVTSIFISYICYLKADASVVRFTGIIQKYEESGTENLNEEDVDLFILDANGSPVYSQGTNTCDTSDSVSLVLDVFGLDYNVLSTEYSLYADESDSILDFDESGFTSVVLL